MYIVRISLKSLVDSFKRIIFAKSRSLNKNVIVMRNVSKYEAIKIKAVFLYVLNKLGKADKLSSLKIIYYANKEHLAKYGRPIIEDDFIAMAKGPVPSFLLDAINCVTRRDNKIRPHVNVLVGSFVATNNGYLLHPLEISDLDELSRTDIACLENSILENGKLSPDELSEKSHFDKAWQDAQGNHRIPMDIIQMAKDSGASDEMLKFIQHRVDFERICD